MVESKFVADPNGITPVELHNDLYLKRDDLFKPFGDNTVNGGKLRQCFMLVDAVKNGYDGLISCCSIYSPQAPITSYVAKHFGMKCVICYGGTTKERLRRFRMPTIVRNCGSEIRIISKSGIHKILYTKAKKIAAEENLFVVDYGFNITEYPDLLLNAVSNQVENLPDDLDNLVITCGSGITTLGVLIGLHRFKKKVKNIYLICTAPNRKQMIDSNLEKYDIHMEYNMIDLFHMKGFKYERGVRAECDGIVLHPNYEAKSYKWLTENIDTKKEKTLLWIVGSKPMI